MQICSIRCLPCLTLDTSHFCFWCSSCSASEHPVSTFCGNHIPICWSGLSHSLCQANLRRILVAKSDSISSIPDSFYKWKVVGIPHSPRWITWLVPYVHHSLTILLLVHVGFCIIILPRIIRGYFLDSVCDQIFEIDWNGETFMHPGSWETFLKRRAERSLASPIVVIPQRARALKGFLYLFVELGFDQLVAVCVFLKLG